MKHFRTIAAALSLLALLGHSATSQEVFVPQLHGVTGVAPNDRLNIRATDSASAPIVGELPPTASGIEVTALNAAGTWGRIGAGEIDGWVSMSFLSRLPDATNSFPDGMRCLGNEPFWSLIFLNGSMTYATPYEDQPDLPVLAAATRIPPGNQIFGFDTDGPGARLSGVIEAGWCSDGMSERTYGWQVVLLRQASGEIILETGCCTFDQR